MLAFGGVTGAGLRPLLDLTIRVNPNIMPTAFILCSSIFICFSLVSFIRKNDYSRRVSLTDDVCRFFIGQFKMTLFRWAWWQNNDLFYILDLCSFLHCPRCFGSTFPICLLEGTRLKLFYFNFYFRSFVYIIILAPVWVILHFMVVLWLCLDLSVTILKWLLLDLKWVIAISFIIPSTFSSTSSTCSANFLSFLPKRRKTISDDVTKNDYALI